MKSISYFLFSTFCVVTKAWIPSQASFLNPLSLSTPRGTVVLQSSVSNRSGRKRSRVSDPDGPTPDLDQDDIEDVDPNSVEGLRGVMSQDELPRPIPHQPWRRGSLDGCEAPIDADWRQAGEQIIRSAAKLVGGQVLDVTWFLTSLVVTIDESMMIEQRDMFKAEGPPIEVVEAEAPMYYDPYDPDPDDVSANPEEILYQRETEEEAKERKTRDGIKWVTTDNDDPPGEKHNPLEDIEPKVPLMKNDETRPDVALRGVEEEQIRFQEMQKPVDIDSLHRVDTAALSTIAGVILDALTEVEEELNILERHELILASPGAADVLETQKQFNAYRGEPVIVETQDPFESNRVLKGKLLDRNAMDVYINQKGRMVTIPNCFVKCVRIPPPSNQHSGVNGDDDDSA